MKLLISIMVLFACGVSQVCCTEKAASSGSEQSGQSEKALSNSKIERSGNEVQCGQGSGEAHFYKGNSLSDGHLPEEALKEYHLAIAEGYDTVELRYNLGSVLAYQLNRYQDAIEQFRIAVQRDETYWRGRWALAQSLLNTKEYDEALKELLIVKQIDPESDSQGFYTYYTAKALDGLERYDEALKEYEAFLERINKVFPNGPEAHDARERVKAIREKLNLG